MIQPIPLSCGVGFSSLKQIPEYAEIYQEKQVGNCWNYYVTPYCQDWPEQYFDDLKNHVSKNALSVILNNQLKIGLSNVNELIELLGESLGFDRKYLSIKASCKIVFEDALKQLSNQLSQVSNPEKLAWNILVWNLIDNQTFCPKTWTKPDAPGMYISSVFALVKYFIEHEETIWQNPWKVKAKALQMVFSNEIDLISWSKQHPDLEFDLTQKDANLIGIAKQSSYVMQLSLNKPEILANYTYDLAKSINSLYNDERIKDGRYGFKYAIYEATSTLKMCMCRLGMFPLTIESI